MAFKLRKIKLRPWPVTVKLLESNDDGVVTETEFEFVLMFVPFDEVTFKAVVDRVSGGIKEDDGSVKDRPVAELLANNAAIFADLIAGWSKVLDDDNLPIPFTSESLKALVTGPDGLAVSAGINKAIAELRFGIAPAKNSLTSAAPGQTPGLAEAGTSSPVTSPLLA